MMWPDFSVRATEAELMDSPLCDERLLLRTIHQFATINRLVSRFRTLLTYTVLRDMRREPSRTYHLVDIGAGGCDIPVWLLKRAAVRGCKLRVTAIDAEARTVAWAQGRYGRVPGLQIVHADAASLADHGPVDYVYANHFLHHLDDEAVVRMIRLIAATAARGYVLGDIRRGMPAYAGVTLLLGCAFRGSFAYADGRLSVRKGFTRAELAALCAEAVGENRPARVVRLFPSRLAVLGGEAFAPAPR